MLACEVAIAVTGDCWIVFDKLHEERWLLYPPPVIEPSSVGQYFNLFPGKYVNTTLSI
jgi:hypothetical protein